MAILKPSKLNILAGLKGTTNCDAKNAVWVCPCLTWRTVVNVVLAQISGESGVAAALVSTTQVLTHPSVSARIPHTLVNVHLTSLTCVARV